MDHVFRRVYRLTLGAILSLGVATGAAVPLDEASP